MDTLKYIFIDRFKLNVSLIMSFSVSLILLMVRIKLTHSFFLIFLVWNLFLAIIPYTITTYLLSISELKKGIIILSFIIWLLFLPNAPYIVTDLLHIKYGGSILWLDALIITSFACNGLIVFFLSLNDMQKLLTRFIKPKIASLLITIIIGLSGFGIYLVRFLRYNSWEIINNTSNLFKDIIEILIYPKQYYEAWLFTLSFTVFLYVSYYLFKLINNSNL